MRGKPSRKGLINYFNGCWFITVNLLLSNVLYSAEISIEKPPQIISTVDIASQLIYDGRNLELSSIKLISRSNQLRKDVNKLRVSARSAKDEYTKQQLSDAANLLASQISQWQQQGADNRQQSSRYLGYGHKLLTQAMFQRWQSRIKLQREISLIPSKHQLLAHNTQIRSVHPSMPKVMQTVKEPVANMSLSVPAMNNQTIPSPLDTSSFQLSRDLHYFAHVEPVASELTVLSIGNEPAVPLNTIHQWYLFISDLKGQPVADKKIQVRGHMPGHVHGLPTQPRITAEVEPGVYLVEGVKFQMIGWWVMEFDIPHNKELDTVKFNIVL
ncbi:FixH family protein [Zooshikella marina]|uniref:FixH family protein n=1 Tax=Zooshikella ganghwensis TaxID=202772 RepID=UPI001BAF4F5F|nr:FixH family protein [Zooshikella ganghwensis]MBU2707076.1 FixH family protein [Zooshikella ganghwensis]